MFTALDVPAIQRVAMMTNGSHGSTRTPCSRMSPSVPGGRFVERKVQDHRRLTVAGESPEIHARDDSDADLKQELLPGEQAFSCTWATPGSRELQPVVGPTEDGQPEQDHKRDMDIVVEEIREQTGGYQNGEDDEDASHRGHIRLAGHQLV